MWKSHSNTKLPTNLRYNIGINVFIILSSLEIPFIPSQQWVDSPGLQDNMLEEAGTKGSHSFQDEWAFATYHQQASHMPTVNTDSRDLWEAAAAQGYTWTA